MDTQDFTVKTQTAGALAPSGFVRLTRRGPDMRSQAGCALILAAVLLVVGGLPLWLFFAHPAGKGDPIVLLLVGVMFAGFGLLLLLAGLRGMRGASLPVPELYIAPAPELAPGSLARLHLRQSGPASIANLKLTLLCERAYRRKVRPRHGSSATVEDHERLYEQVIAEVTKVRLQRGEALTREFALEIPETARVSGPAEPDGSIRWTLELSGSAGFMRAIHHPFELTIAEDLHRPVNSGVHQ